MSAVEGVTPYEDGVLSGAKIVAYRCLEIVFSMPCNALHVRNPFEFRVPSKAEIMANLVFLTHAIQFRRAIKTVDYYLRPPIEGYGLLDYNLIDEISQVGFVHAEKQIQSWLRQASQSLSETPWTGNAGIKSHHAGSVLNLVEYEEIAQMGSTVNPLLVLRQKMLVAPTHFTRGDVPGWRERGRTQSVPRSVGTRV
eukprot:c20630_g1_i3.p1 GENE.c20630_g1_i3~~c20630_g1_i3.p1  ORF type:complete len:205 (+),score=50.62 c20630_g1_i3:28-615(+)